MKGGYGSWALYVDCAVFPVSYGECVELGSVKCGDLSMGCFGLGVWVVPRGECCMGCGCGPCGVVGVLYLGERKKVVRRW